jgi:hypothetical protein
VIADVLFFLAALYRSAPVLLYFSHHPFLEDLALPPQIVDYFALGHLREAYLYPQMLFP